MILNLGFIYGVGFICFETSYYCTSAAIMAVFCPRKQPLALSPFSFGYDRLGCFGLSDSKSS